MTCILLYGLDSLNLQFAQLGEHVILVEPRKMVLDFLQTNRQKLTNVTVVPKLLDTTNSQEKSIYYPKQIFTFRRQRSKSQQDLPKKYFTEGGNMELAREKLHTINIQSLIHNYKIQCIEEFVFNINIDNNSSVLQDLLKYNHIVSKIKIGVEVDLQIDDAKYCLSQTDTRTYVHKNTRIPLPKIHMWSERPLGDVEQAFDLLVSQYSMTHEFVNSYSNNSLHLFLIEQLEAFFTKTKTPESTPEILIFFNPNYLSNRDNIFQILYPLRDNTLYINKDFNIIYGSRLAMYMLYQILKSVYFQQFLTEKEQGEKLYKIFYKQYFYDYLYRSFTVHEI